MARFSITGAATAGFGVIRREPLAVLAWGGLVLLALVVPLGLMGWTVLPDFLAFAKLSADPSATGASDPAFMNQMMRIQSKMMLFNLAYWLGGTVLQAVLAAAVFRIVLEPEQKGFFFLKLGLQEMWLALVALVMGVLAYIAWLTVALVVVVCAAIAYFVGAQSGTAAGVAACGVVAVVLGLAGTGVLVWAVVRLSMAGPMSFAERKFLLFESWSLTRGQSWPLVGMVLLLALIILGLELAVYAVFGVGIVAFGGPLMQLVKALEGQPPQTVLQALWPFAAGFAAVGSLLAGPAMAVVFAPWAAVYRDLREPA